MANTHKEKFEDKLHLGEITSITCVSKGEQVWVFGTERLSPLKEKCYESYTSRLTKLYRFHSERQASVAFKALGGASYNYKLVN